MVPLTIACTVHVLYVCTNCCFAMMPHYIMQLWQKIVDNCSVSVCSIALYSVSVVFRAWHNDVMYVVNLLEFWYSICHFLPQGSVCAMCESILRAHGLKTGFYSSVLNINIITINNINGDSCLMYTVAGVFGRPNIPSLYYIYDNCNGFCVYCYYMCILQLSPSAGSEGENTAERKTAHKVAVCILLLGVLQLTG